MMPRQGMPPTAWALGAAFLIIAHQVAGKATRDALFLSQFDVTDLPKVVMVAAVLSMLMVIGMARLLAQFGPSVVMPLAFTASAVLFALDWSALPRYPHAVAVALYLQMAMFGAVLISGFWSVVNERFDPYTAKSTIARVGAAATLGGVLGGLVAGEVATAIDLRAMLILLALLHLACAAAVRAIGETRRPSTSQPTQVGFGSGLRLLASQRYLQWMALLMVLVAMLAALLDYAFKSQASSQIPRGEHLVAFFGQFYATVGVLTFVVQSLLGPRFLRRFGIGATLSIMPAVTLICGAIGALSPGSGGAIWIRAAQMALANSFFRSAFELLYTPLPPLTKRPTKAIIDVASDRLGDVLGSGLLLGVLAFAPSMSVRMVVVLAVVLAAGVLLVVYRLHGGYIEQLASSLRAGSISLEVGEVVDATTRLTLAEVSVGSERELLMARIRHMKQTRTNARPVTQSSPPRDASPPLVADPAADALAAATIELLSGDLARVRRCLHDGFMDLRLVPYLVPLLAQDGLAEDVRMELRWVAPQIIGTLSDALTNPDLALAARQRLPSVLEVVHNPHAVAALMNGVEDDEFNVRYSAARALARMRGRDPYMRLDTARVHAAVAREVGVEPATWMARDRASALDLPTELTAVADGAGSSLNYSLEHVFTLLGLVLDRDALSLALHAVASQDRNLSGTALEYLENVLPDEVRRELWPRLAEAAKRT